jgi:hypothetical protein
VSRQEKRQTKNFRKEAISKKERLEKGGKSKKLLLPIIVAGALLAFAFCVRRDALRCLAALGLFMRTESCKHCSSTLSFVFYGVVVGCRGVLSGQ